MCHHRVPLEACNSLSSRLSLLPHLLGLLLLLLRVLLPLPRHLRLLLLLGLLLLPELLLEPKLSMC